MAPPKPRPALAPAEDVGYWSRRPFTTHSPSRRASKEEAIEGWWRPLSDTVHRRGTKKRFVHLTRLGAEWRSRTSLWIDANERRRVLLDPNSTSNCAKMRAHANAVDNAKWPAQEHTAFADFARLLATHQSVNDPKAGQFLLRFAMHLLSATAEEKADSNFQAKVLLATYAAMDKRDPVDTFCFGHVALRHRQGKPFDATDLGLCLSVVCSFIGIREKNVRAVLVALRKEHDQRAPDSPRSVSSESTSDHSEDAKTQPTLTRDMTH